MLYCSLHAIKLWTSVGQGVDKPNADRGKEGVKSTYFCGCPLRMIRDKDVKLYMYKHTLKFYAS